MGGFFSIPGYKFFGLPGPSSSLPAIPAIIIAGLGLANPRFYLYSADGVTWTQGTLPVANQFNSSGMAYGGSPTAKWLGMTRSTDVLTSPDGVTWTVQPTVMPLVGFDVAWSPTLNLFAAISNTGTTQAVATSPDGLTWTLRTTPNNPGWFSIKWLPRSAQFAAVTSNLNTTNIVMTSPDGINWTQRSSAVTVANSKFIYEPPSGGLDTLVRLGGSVPYAGSSDGGATWATFNNPTFPSTPATNTMYAVALIGGTAYGITTSNGLCKTSAVDLASGWTSVQDNIINPPPGETFPFGVFSPGLNLWIMGGTGLGTQDVITTKSGTAWNFINAGTVLGEQIQRLAVAG